MPNKYPKMHKFKSTEIPKGLSAAAFHKGHPLAMPSLLECAKGIRAYYKGTSLSAPCSFEREAEFFATVKEGGRKQIEAFLRNGESLSSTIAILTGQLDLMEAGLCKHQGSNVGVRMYIEGHVSLVRSGRGGGADRQGGSHHVVDEYRIAAGAEGN
jgi:hypothetical protein